MLLYVARLPAVLRVLVRIRLLLRVLWWRRLAMRGADGGGGGVPGCALTFTVAPPFESVHLRPCANACDACARGAHIRRRARGSLRHARMQHSTAAPRHSATVALLRARHTPPTAIADCARRAHARLSGDFACNRNYEFCPSMFMQL